MVWFWILEYYTAVLLAIAKVEFSWIFLSTVDVLFLLFVKLKSKGQYR